MRIVYEALHNSDTTEGRGPMKSVALFTSEADAEQCAEECKIMGVEPGGEVRKRTVYVSYAAYRDGQHSVPA